MVGSEGFEPSHPKGYNHLKVACLPIPPRAQTQDGMCDGVEPSKT